MKISTKYDLCILKYCLIQEKNLSRRETNKFRIERKYIIMTMRKKVKITTFRPLLKFTIYLSPKQLKQRPSFFVML